MLTLVFLSLLLVIHSIVTNKYKSLPTKKVAKKLAKETLENVWNNASLLCAEPIPAVLPHITCRLLVSSWLIGATFILFFLGCFLRTEFTAESYNCIDTLSDLIKSGIPPIMVKEVGTFDRLKVLAAKDPVVQEWLNGFDEESILRSAVDFLILEGYDPILSGEKVLIIEDFFLDCLLGQFLNDNNESKEFFVNKGGLYISQHEIYFDLLHLIYNTTWIRTTPQELENSQLSVEPIFETQVFNYLNFKVHHLIEQVTWKKPVKETVALDLTSVFVLFCMLFTLFSGTAVVVVTELFFNRFA